MVRKIVLSIIAVLTVCSVAFAQNLQVTGTVKDAAGKAVVGAAVFVEGTTVGTTTGVDGSFKLSVPVDANLYVSFMGYEDAKVAVNGKSVINIVLKDDYQAIDEVVVQTFGEVKKKDLTGSITAVSSKDLQKMTVSSVTKALEGAAPGVQTYSSSGQPGFDSSIIIRGMGSIEGNKGALIVVDGVPYSSSLSTINPLDIESMVVSKDAAANALYGSRAANGVIFITTKKGARNQKANITFEAKWGWNEIGVKEHETMTNPGDYYEYVYGGLYNYGFDGYGGDVQRATALAQNNLMYMVGNYMAYRLPEGKTVEQGYTPINPETGKIWDGMELLYADNYDDYLFTKQFRQEYTVSVSGGNQKLDYYVSGSFLNDPSYVIESAFKRFSGRASLNAQVNKNIKIGTNVSFSRRDIDNPGYSGANTGSVFMWTLWQNPTVPYYARDLEGKIRYNDDGSKMFDQGGGETLSPYGPTEDMFNAFANYANPEQIFSRNINKEIRDNIYANAYVDITFLKNFKFTANFTLDNIYRMDTYYSNNEYGSAAKSTYNGIVEKYVDNYTSINTQQLLSYHKVLNEVHTIDAMIGHEFNKTSDSAVDAYKKNIFFPGIGELGNAVSVYSNGSTSGTTETAIEGYFFRGNYSYDNRYSASISYRYDGASRFAYDKWGHFWSVGGAWRISEEEFAKDANWIDDLRVRATYGVSGNQISSEFPFTNLWSVSESNGAPSLSLSSVGNRNLSWERNKQIDLGVDFRFFDRVYGSLDYYNRRTHDLIWNRPTPASTGLSSRLENVGVLGNVGFEFDVTVDLIKNENVYWNIGINGAFSQNKLIDFPAELGDPTRGGDYVSGRFLRGKGKSYYNLYLFKYAGVNPENGNELFWKDTKDAEGNVVGRETTENFAEATQYEMGDQMPDLVGGIRTSFRWKNFDVNVLAAYQLGGKQWDGNSANLYDPGRAMFNVSDDLIGNTWTPENPNAEFPRLMYNGVWNAPSSTCDYLYRSASYFNLKNLNVGYTLPQKWTSRIGVQSLRVFFNSDNLCLITEHDGFDPRTSMTAHDGFGFPQARTFTFGVTLNM